VALDQTENVNMARRSSLANMKVGKATKKVAAATTATTTTTPPADDMATTAVVLARSDIALLSRVAASRKGRMAGRHSVSSVLRDLIERHRDELEGESG
jgi:hypothetical protein